MLTIHLSDDVYKKLHIIKRSEWAKNQYTGRSISDNSVRTAFLPGYGSTLFFENLHFLVVGDNVPTKRYAIWHGQKVIGHCEIPQSVADRANKAANAVFRFETESVVGYGPEAEGRDVQ